MPADPTLATLAAVRDPAKYVTTRAVPVFVPHERVGRDGTPYTVTEADLHEIAENMARREREDGILGRVTAGHIRLDLPEDQQPTLLGFFTNPRVGRFGPAGKMALLVDRHIRRDKAEVAANLPFRSSEYYPAAKVISGIAMLLRDPALNLGTLAYAAGPRGVTHYVMLEADPMPTTPRPLAARIEAAARTPAAGDLLACLMLLQGVEQEGWEFTPEETAGELAELLALPSEGRAASVDKLRRRLANDLHRPPDHYEAAMRHLHAHPGMTYEAAERYVLGGR